MLQPYTQVVAEYDNASNETVGYVYGLERISQDRGGSIRVFLADGQGSIRELVNAVGNVTDTYDYFAFGEILNRTGSTENEWTYTGEAYDPNVGFIYLRARWMNPENGRFTSVDPYSGDPQAPVSLHRYLYANASPVSFSDASGEFTIAMQLSTVSISNTLASAAIATLATAALIELARDLPVRMNHYTKMEYLPLIMAGGIASPSGKNYFTPDYYWTGESARSALALNKTPDVFINLTIYPIRDELEPDYPRGHRVDPDNFQPGGGVEFWTRKIIPFWSRQPVIVPLF
jgi:RHS repeat-associated protein